MSIVPEDADLQMQWTRWLNRRNTAARDHLIVHYSPLVKFVAGRVGAGLVGFDDEVARLLVDGEEVEIAFADVARANAIYEFTREDFAKRASR